MQREEEILLIKKAQRGSMAAYEQLIREYEQYIYNLCLRFLKDQEEAYDAAQEICFKIWRQIGSFQGKSKFSTWVYRLSVNQCLDILRKNKKKQSEVSLYQDEETMTEEKLQSDQSIWEDISDTMTQKELSTVLLQAIGELKEDHRMIILLKDMDELSYEEIAEVLNLSMGTVKSRISRARKALKRILEQDKEPYRSFFRHKNR